ncbi:putative lipoprotein [Stanieria cyanosphaera PCC 7437]|uniref:Lipoprotein n=1 Tax=Stanieria cyanosphaera (strain ATCC 29371 / PCC 7437) TaxID=111780 RepID=K9XS34_STAC7|nr:hypothetical protein [Stanieria cyanosphaera]AFZ34894.1 putative lipoprotein [Stanieria cyanosphaera PCC 7437]
MSLKTIKILGLPLILALSLFAVACSETETPGTTGEPEAGEQIEEGAEDVGEGVEQGAEDLGEDIEQGAEDVGEDIENAGDEIENN